MDKCRAFDVWLDKRLCEMEAIGLDEAFYAGWQSRQAEVDQLNEVLDERTKEWLEAIELGTYFQDVAKPLKDEVDQLQSQINEMAEVGLIQESAIKGKDKRIEELQAKVDAIEHILGCAMIAPKEVFQYADRIGRALRGEHES